MFAFFSTGGNPLKQESMTKVRKQKINGYSLASHENAFHNPHMGRDPPFGNRCFPTTDLYCIRLDHGIGAFSSMGAYRVLEGA